MGIHTSTKPDPRRAVLDAIRRIVQALRLFDTQARKAGLSAAQLFVLRTIRENPGLSVNELAARTHTHQSSVSVVAGKLARRGLIRRSPAPQDARRVEFAVTPRGIVVLRSTPPAAQQRILAALTKMPEASRLAELLDELVVKMGLNAGAVPPLFFEAAAKSPARRRRRA